MKSFNFYKPCKLLLPINCRKTSNLYEEKVSTKTELILAIILTIVCLAGLYAYNKSYKKQTEVIERDGITVVGEVVEKGRSKHRRGDNTYTIKYKFEYQGENYFGFQEFANKWYYALDDKLNFHLSVNKIPAGTV